MQSPNQTKQPWDIDANAYSGLLQELSKGEIGYCLAPGGEKDWKSVQTLYQQSPVTGLVIANVEVIYNRAMHENFLAWLTTLDARGDIPAFQANWIKIQGAEGAMRRRVHQALLGRSDPTLKNYGHVKVVPMFHGTKRQLIPSILKTNLANLAKVDPGFFGQGIYFTSYAKYAESYQNDRTLLFNWVSFFSAHPVHYEDDRLMWEYLRQYELSILDPSKAPSQEQYERAFAHSKHFAKGNLPTYDAHFALVTSSNPTDPSESKYFPIKDSQKETYDELVVFYPSQILPRYVVTLGPNGMKTKRIIISHTLKDLVATLIYSENYSGLPFSLRAILQKFKESLQSKQSSLALTDTQNWLLAHIACLNVQCDRLVKKKAIQNLIAYFQEEELATLDEMPLPNDVEQNWNQKFISALQIDYRQRDTIPTLFGGVRLIDETYTDLVIVSEKEKKREKPEESQAKLEKEPEEVETISRVRSLDDVAAHKVPIALPELFDEQEKQEAPKRILLVGRAGIGKSTLCQYMAYRWALGELWNDKFQALFWIPLRALKSFKGNETSAFILEHCLSLNKKTFLPKELALFLQKNKEKILFVLDGYDETQFQKGSPEAKILQELLDYPRWILTSRPYAIHSIKADCMLENVGFNEESILEHLSKLLPDKKVKPLQALLQTNRWLSQIAGIPFNLELICHLWNAQANPSFESSSSLYRKITLEMQRWFLQKSGHPAAATLQEGGFELLDPQFARIMSLLEAVAWRGLERQNLLISFKDPSMNDLYKTFQPSKAFHHQLKEIGFLQSTGKHLEFLEDSFYFAHLTFQEFFAARYLARLLKKDRAKAEQLIQREKFNPQFQMVIWFTAGLLKESRPLLTLFFDLMDSPQDLIGFYAFQLRSRCLEECGCPDFLPRRDLYLQEAKNWCQWLLSPSLGQLVFQPMAELLQFSHLLRREILPTLRREIAEGACLPVLRIAKAVPSLAVEVFPDLLKIAKREKPTSIRQSDVWVLASEAISEAVKESSSLAKVALPILLEGNINSGIPQIRIMKALHGQEDFSRAIASYDRLRYPSKQADEAWKISPEIAKRVLTTLFEDFENNPDPSPNTGITLLFGLKKFPTLVKDFIPSLYNFFTYIHAPSENRCSALDLLEDSIKVPQDLSKLIFQKLIYFKEGHLSWWNVEIYNSVVRTLITLMTAAADLSKAEFAKLFQVEEVKGKNVHRYRLFEQDEGIDVTLDKSSIDALFEAVKWVQEKNGLPPNLLMLFKDKRSHLRVCALLILSPAVGLSPDFAKVAFPNLLQTLNDENWFARSLAIKIISKTVKSLPGVSTKIFPQLLATLKDDNWMVQELVLEALTNIVRAAPELGKEIFSTLVTFDSRNSLLKEKNSAVLLEIVKVNPGTAKAILPKLLRESNLSIINWKDLGKAIAAKPDRTREVLSYLLESLKDRSYIPSSYRGTDLREYFVEALGEAVKQAPVLAKEILPILLQALQNKELPFSEPVAVTLREIGKADAALAAKALSALLLGLKNCGDYIHPYFMEAMGQVVKSKPDLAEKAFDPLLQQLKSKKLDWYRETAAQALFEILKVSPSLAKKIGLDLCRTLLSDQLVSKVQSTPELLRAMVMGLDEFSILGSQEAYLILLVTVCIHENIALSIQSNNVVFYKNGLQQVTISKSNLAELITKYVKGYPEKVTQTIGPL